MPPLLSLLLECACGQVQSCCSSLGPPSSLTRGASRIWVIPRSIQVLPSFTQANQLPLSTIVPTHVGSIVGLACSPGSRDQTCPRSGPSRTPISLLVESRDPNPNPYSFPIPSLTHLGQSLSVAFLPVTFSVQSFLRKPSNPHSSPSHPHYQTSLSLSPSSTIHISSYLFTPWFSVPPLVCGFPISILPLPSRHWVSRLLFYTPGTKNLTKSSRSSSKNTKSSSICINKSLSSNCKIWRGG